MDDEDKALSEINLAVKADPQNIDYVAIRADLYYYNEEYAKANMDFEKIISTNPGHPAGYIGMGRNLLAQKRYDAAIEKFNYAITLDANLSQPYTFRADCYLNKREYPTAENYYDATCLTARMGEYRRSLEYLKLAFEKGYHEIKHIEQDDDLEAIRKFPEYKALIEKYKH